jgi:hypothetical protein
MFLVANRNRKRIVGCCNICVGFDEIRKKLGDSPHVFETVNDYLMTRYDDGELSPEAIIGKFRLVQTEGNR